MTDRSVHERLRILSVVVLAVLSLLAARLWLLQVVKGDSFDRLAEANRMRTIPVRAPRGTIYDAEGRVIVGNRLAFTVSVVPSGLRDPDGDTIGRLSSVLDLTEDEIRDTLAKGSDYPYMPIRLKRDVPIETVIAIEEDRSHLPGVFVEEEWVRVYPEATLAAHILGYLGEADRDDLAVGYRPKDLLGKAGIEEVFEPFLRGTEGERLVEVNALSRPIREVDAAPPRPGLDVHLTIDLELQRYAESSLRRGMESILDQSEHGLAGNGAVVVLHAPTGAVLAMSSLPEIDLMKLHGDERGVYFQQTISDRRAPMVNRATQAFPPGSTYKIVAAIAALESGAIGPDEVYFADGYGKYGRRDWTVASGLPPAGEVTIVEALARSANDFFWEMALRPQVGNDVLAQWAERLGFGHRTDIPIPEKAGIVPTAAYKRATHGQPWVELDTMNVAIGQGDTTVTPLQMAQAYMILGNEGRAPQLHLVRRISAPDGRVAFEVSADEQRVLAASHRTWSSIKEGLRDVVQWTRGTAYSAFAGAPYDPAGKTGTAQNQGTAAHGWFAGFAPASEPEIVVVVFAEWGESGARSAPIVRDIMDYYFLGIDRDQPAEAEAADED